MMSYTIVEPLVSCAGVAVASDGPGCPAITLQRAGGVVFLDVYSSPELAAAGGDSLAAFQFSPDQFSELLAHAGVRA